ncbi:unannotated protein [freshwater metagenome]|uniref:Unannotated protein n=1 Tax=freshwater metagenome TaxID=449393 RepID=A0A6J7P402_9ZZZZ
MHPRVIASQRSAANEKKSVIGFRSVHLKHLRHASRLGDELRRCKFDGTARSAEHFWQSGLERAEVDAVGRGLQ